VSDRVSLSSSADCTLCNRLPQKLALNLKAGDMVPTEEGEVRQTDPTPAHP